MDRFFSARGHQWSIGIVCVVLSMLVAACGSSGTTKTAGASSITGGASNSGGSSNSGSSSTGGACTASNITVNGISTEKFCGTAKAQATYQGQTYSWTQGACFNLPEGVGVNIGQEVLDPSNTPAGNALKKQYNYFGAEAQATADGTYQGLLSGFNTGVDMTATGSVTFSNNLQAGSFTGKSILGQAPVTASWTCA